MAEKIREESQRFDVSFADIVRECVEVELPKLKDRYRKYQIYESRITLNSCIGIYLELTRKN